MQNSSDPGGTLAQVFIRSSVFSLVCTWHTVVLHIPRRIPSLSRQDTNLFGDSREESAMFRWTGENCGYIYEAYCVNVLDKFLISFLLRPTGPLPVIIRWDMSETWVLRASRPYTPQLSQKDWIKVHVLLFFGKSISVVNVLISSGIADLWDCRPVVQRNPLVEHKVYEDVCEEVPALLPLCELPANSKYPSQKPTFSTLTSN